MLLSPLLFERLGWRGVAGATPKILLFGGSAFFCACIAYQVRHRRRQLGSGSVWPWLARFCCPDLLLCNTAGAKPCLLLGTMHRSWPVV